MINDKEQAKTFSRNLNNCIAASGKTQRQVALELGFNPTTFNTWCVGKIVPSLGKVQHIADYFGVNKTDLLENHTEEENRFGAYTVLVDAYVKAPVHIQEAVRIMLRVGNNK